MELLTVPAHQGHDASRVVAGYAKCDITVCVFHLDELQLLWTLYVHHGRVLSGGRVRCPSAPLPMRRGLKKCTE